jgi:hypothetical protein
MDVNQRVPVYLYREQGVYPHTFEVAKCMNKVYRIIMKLQKMMNLNACINRFYIRNNSYNISSLPTI